MLNIFAARFRNYLLRDELVRLRQALDPYPNLQRSVVELNNLEEVNKVFGWAALPVLDRPDINDFEYVEDANQRRLRDAESLATVMANAKPKIALEIGTSDGMGTVLMAVNAPQAQIYTVNIPPEGIIAGEGGHLTTIALEKEKIGACYKGRGLQNVVQIYANTARWEPDFGPIDVAFIDGCHDADFVYNDTKKVLKNMRPGGFILWHDFNLNLTRKFGWISEVCTGVERLYVDGLLNGRIIQIRDSWIGIYQVAV